MGEGHALRLDQFDKERWIVTTGVDLFYARERRRPWEAPCVNMEHRGNRHIDVVAMESTLARSNAKHGEFRQRVQHQLPVAVVDALRQACGSGRIERRRLDVLVKVRKVKIRRRCREKLLVFADELKFAGRWRFTVAEDNELLDLGQFGQKRMYEVGELVIDEQRR